MRKFKLKKPQLGHLKKAKIKPYKFCEFRGLDLTEDKYKVGQELGISKLDENDRVTVIGMSMGRGFQGVIKRHHFHRGPKTHGSDHHRAPGSIGMCSFPSRVFKGKKLPGRDGVKKSTIKDLRIIKFLKDKSLMLLHGSVPGKKDSYLAIRLSEKAKVSQ